jgi:hypothetical protein
MSSPPSDDKQKAAVSIHGRSVVDYVDEKELLAALKTVTPQGIAKNDWVLPVPDPEAEEQTPEGEMARLLTLKSYLLLDAENEEAFDKLTEEARDIFGVPTSLISLVDLSRQFFFSNTGADVRETPRDMAFCSHTILNKKGIVVVNDTKEDERFKNNPLVTQAPFLRFYAGAPLISPEGHKVGITLKDSSKLCHHGGFLTCARGVFLFLLFFAAGSLLCRGPRATPFLERRKRQIEGICG